MFTAAQNDLRLVSVWHGDPDDRTIHFSLYNSGSSDFVACSLCMTGGFWVMPGAVLRGAILEQSLSNFTAVRPLDAGVLKAGGVWTFSIAGLNTHPHRAGDGPLSAYVCDGEDRCHPVAVQPLQRSHDSESLGSVPRIEKPQVPPFLPTRTTLSVVPFPNATTVSVAPLATVGPVLSLIASAPGDEAACRSVNALVARVAPGAVPVFALTGETGTPFMLRLRPSPDARLGTEGYRLTFDSGNVTLEAQTNDGHRHGLVTLAQIVLGARGDAQRFGFPVGGTITDVPRFNWRGLHLDVARTFYPVAEVLAVVDLMAWLKLSVFHLHLNDDEGWRIAIDGYPEIAEIAAWRGHGLPIPPLLGSGPAPYGGVYSAADLAALHKHATGLGITILPEIDVPGHGHAALTALPHLREVGDAGGYHSIQGFFANALNPVLPQTHAFLTAVFDTVLHRFPGPHIHIGGDEVADDTWFRSPAAIAAAKGRHTTGALQSRILNPVHQQLTRAGRRTVVWEDAILNADLAPGQTTAIVWQHPDRAHVLAERGYDVVLAPGNAYYLDMAETDDWNSMGGHWAGTVPLEKTYDFEAGLGWPPSRLERLRGVHACIWGENMHDRRNFDALVFPRILAFAERAWIDRANKDYAGFLDRISAMPSSVLRPQEDR